MKQFNIIMFCVLVVFGINFGMSETVGAQDNASNASAPVVAVPAGTPVAAPAAVNLDPSQAVVAIPAPAAPPEWATNLLNTISKLPVVGPYVTQFLLWLGILAAILTTLVGASLSLLASLKKGFAWAGLDNAVAAIESFQKGPIMYWLTYFSNFNAKKPSA